MVARVILLTWTMAVAGPHPVAFGLGLNCQFVLGFRALHDLDPSDVGDCQDNQAFGPNGDALQHTTHGLLVWRKADNFTAFTDGYQTIVNGPFSLQMRLNNQRFPWEANPDALPKVTDGSRPLAAWPLHAWSLTFDHVERRDGLQRTDDRFLETLRPAGTYLTVFFGLRNNQDRPVGTTADEFSLTDAQGHTFVSPFQLRLSQADGSTSEFDGSTVTPGATVTLSLTFDVDVDAADLVLHFAGVDLPVGDIQQT